ASGIFGPTQVMSHLANYGSAVMFDAYARKAHSPRGQGVRPLPGTAQHPVLHGRQQQRRHALDGDRPRLDVDALRLEGLQLTTDRPYPSGRRRAGPSASAVRLNAVLTS